MKKILLVLIVMVISLSFMGVSCTDADTERTLEVAKNLKANQATPTDINYSLERYNLIRRAYWVNGQREKANSLSCPIEKPLSYIVLMDAGVIVNSFVVDGKVSSLNSYLSPDSEFYGYDGYNKWLPDVDGSYGTNDNGIFFFTPDGNYIESTLKYMYTDALIKVDNPTVKVGGK